MIAIDGGKPLSLHHAEHIKQHSALEARISHPVTVFARSHAEAIIQGLAICVLQLQRREPQPHARVRASGVIRQEVKAEEEVTVGSIAETLLVLDPRDVEVDVAACSPEHRQLAFRRAVSDAAEGPEEEETAFQTSCADLPAVVDAREVHRAGLEDVGGVDGVRKESYLFLEEGDGCWRSIR